MHKHGRLSALEMIFSQSFESKITVNRLSLKPPVMLVIEADFANSLKLSKTINMYAYDAYILDCAIRHKAPLLTLDRKLISAAQSINIQILEV
jgi:predicted nucleic acid-binding protein